MRRPLIIGNWKLNGNINTVNKMTIKLDKKLNNISTCDIVIAPPTAYLYLAQNNLCNSKIMLGAQNVDLHLSGAFTGEVSANMLKDIGVKYTIIGHSERRFYHKENNEIIAEKFSLLKEVGIIPVLCIGENETELKNGITELVCAHQIDSILNKVNISEFKDTVIAYEPIWAIGTGKSATPKQIQLIHKFIRNHIAKYDLNIAEQLIIQYGGSVQSTNADKLFVCPDIDGALVGKAALKAESFAMIVNAVIKAKQI